MTAAERTPALDRWIKERVDEAPPLTDEQRHIITTALLSGGGAR